MSSIEWIAITCSIVYLILAVRNSVWCFVVGLFSSLLWAYSSYNLYNLQWDAMLNAFYAVMSVYGWFAWQAGQSATDELPITERSLTTHALYVIVVVCSTSIMTWGGVKILGTSFALWDSLSTVLSILGTILLTRRIISTWIYLLIADLIYVGIYAASGAYLFMGMMIIYSVMAIVGYSRWQRIRLAPRHL